MGAKDYFLKYLKNIVYSIVTIIYLISLHVFNKELLNINFSNSFELLQYRSYLPLKYFGIAVLLFLIGGILFVRLFFTFRDDIESFKEAIILIIFEIVTLVLLISILILINNPILRAVLGVLFVATIGISSANK